MPPRAKKQKTSNSNGDTAMQNGNSSHPWADLPSALSGALEEANKAGNNDGQLQAFTTSDAITRPATFGIKYAGSSNAVLVTVTNGKADIGGGNAKDALFTLSALPEQWQEFFKQTPVAPYQSYWGQYSVLRVSTEALTFRRHVRHEHQTRGHRSPRRPERFRSLDPRLAACARAIA